MAQTDQVKTFTSGSGSISLRFDGERACFSITRADKPYPSISNARYGVDCASSGGKRFSIVPLPGRQSIQEFPLKDVHGVGQQLRILTAGGADPFDLTLWVNVYDDRPFLMVRLVVSNRSGSPIHLHNFNLIRAERNAGGQVRFAAGDKALDFFKVGWHDWVYSGLRHSNQKDVTTLLGPFVGKMLFNPATPPERRRGSFWSDGWGILTDQKTALVAGLASTADQFGLVHAACSPVANGIALIAQADGVRLDPGEEFQSEWGYVQFIDLPQEDPAADYVEAVARQMKARLPQQTPPAKWTHWYHYFQSITEERFTANLETIDSLRDTLPIRTVQLDDGYQSAWGDWTTCNRKFPHGLAYLAQRVAEKGFTPGLWLAPFVVDPRSKLAREHPDWLVKDGRGRPIRSGFFYQFYGNALDTSNPAVLEHIRSLLDTVAHEWGFGFVKTDFVYAAALPGVRQDPKVTGAQAFRRGMQAVRQGIGEETFLLGCGCPFGPAIGIVDAIRIGPDTAPDWFPYLWSVPWSKPLLKNEKSIASLRNNIRHTLNLSVLHRRWWWNDPDCLMVRDYDTRLSEEEILSNVTLVGLCGGLLINSDDLTRLSPERQMLISLLLPTLSRGGRPLDLLQNEMAELYDLPLQTTWGQWHVTAVFNWADKPATKVLRLARLGLDSSLPYHVFDFWKETYWRQSGGEIILGDIPAHGCRLLRICRDEGKPCLMGDTLHITQGMEIESFEVVDGEVHVKLMNLGRRVEGKLWYWTESGVNWRSWNNGKI